MQVFRAFFEEFDAILRDKGVLFIFLGGLLIYAMCYPLPYSKQVVCDIDAVAVDLDGTALSRKLLSWADATEEVRICASAGSLDEAEQLVRDGKAFGILVIPEGFERGVLRGEQAHVAGYASVTYLVIYRRVMTGFVKAAATLSAGIEVRRFTRRGLDRGPRFRRARPRAGGRAAPCSTPSAATQATWCRGCCR